MHKLTTRFQDEALDLVVATWIHSLTGRPEVTGIWVEADKRQDLFTPKTHPAAIHVSIDDASFPAFVEQLRELAEAPSGLTSYAIQAVGDGAVAAWLTYGRTKIDLWVEKHSQLDQTPRSYWRLLVNQGIDFPQCFGVANRRSIANLSSRRRLRRPKRT